MGRERFGSRIGLGVGRLCDRDRKCVEISIYVW